MRKNMPSAQYLATARLKDYALRFIDFSPNFEGAYSTICEEEGSCGDSLSSIWKTWTSEEDMQCSALRAHLLILFLKLVA